jgi:twinkle protein
MSVEIYTPEDCAPQMFEEYLNGKEKGTTTYNAEIDEFWKWRRQEFNVLTGYANEGKSLFFKQLSMIKALEENVKFICSSPEDYPPEEYFDDMIHTLSGKSTDKDRSNYLSNPDEYNYYLELIKDKFIFVYIKPPDNTIKLTLKVFEEIIQKDGNIYGCLIDPLIKFSRPKDMSDRDDIYASHITTLGVDFARRNNVSTTLVMHQLTPIMDSNGLYPKPNMYRVKGGGTWADGCDNVLYVHRPNYSKDKVDPSVVFGSQKIKKQKLVGVPGDYAIKFNRQTNRFTDLEGKDLFNFEKYKYGKSN